MVLVTFPAKTCQNIYSEKCLLGIFDYRLL